MHASHVFAFHRVLARGSFQRLAALAVGLLLLAGSVLVYAGIFSAEQGVSKAGTMLVLMSIVFCAMLVLLTASQAANTSTMTLTPHALRGASVYLFGWWLLQILLGTVAALMAEAPPVYGLFAGWIFAFMGNTFGGKAVYHLPAMFIFALLLKLEEKSHWLSELSHDGQWVIYLVVLVAMAIHARAGIRHALHADPSSLKGREVAPAVRRVNGRPMEERLAIGLGPAVEHLHWSLVAGCSIAVASVVWMGSLNAHEYYGLIGASGTAIVVGYLECFWYVYVRGAHGRSVLALAPGLPTVSTWNKVVGMWVLQRAMLVGFAHVAFVVLIGTAVYGEYPAPSWWWPCLGLPLIASLAALARYDQSLLVRGRVLIAISLGTYIPLAVYLVA